MSNTSQGTGWWQASDGKWYPPETHPSAPPRPPMPPQAPTHSPAAKKRRRWPWITLGVIVLLFVVIGLTSKSPTTSTSKSAGSKSTAPAAATSTSKGLTPQAFFSTMNNRAYPPGTNPNAATSWGSFGQYTYSLGQPNQPLTEASAGADHALGALGGPVSPNQATSVNFYVFPNVSDAAAFYASPPTGIIDFPFEGKAPLTGVTLPSDTKAFSVTECGSNGNGNTEVSPTSCSHGGSPYVVGSVLYAVHGFLVTAVGYASANHGMPSAVKGAEKSIPTLKTAVSFAEHVANH